MRLRGVPKSSRPRRSGLAKLAKLARGFAFPNVEIKELHATKCRATALAERLGRGRPQSASDLHVSRSCS
jgi:hypothetical protein